tara:strand:- start:14386 stop:15798 length:1413 start_codon:yes stop_codon:yes gene_type:complete
MPDFSSISRLGSVNGVQYNANAAAGNYERENSNFLKLFSGEVLTVFNRETIFKDLTMRRSISSGKSASFPITGRFSSRYHRPGDWITGQGNKGMIGEKIITIDDLLIADVSLSDLDEAKLHWDVRSIYSKELGRALARSYDQRLARTLLTASESDGRVDDWDSKRFQLNSGTYASVSTNTITMSANFQTAELSYWAVGTTVYGEDSGAYAVITTAPSNGAATFVVNPIGAIGTGSDAAFTVGERLFVLNKLPGGTSYTGINLNGAADRNARGDLIVENLYKACQALDEKDAPSDGRVVVLSPGAYYDVLNSDRAINTDWNGGSGQNGTFKGNSVARVAGFEVRLSNHLGINSYTSGQTYAGINNQAATTRGERPNYINGRDGSDGQAAAGYNDYWQDEQGNTSSIANLFGLAFTKETVGTVALKDLSMQMTGSEYKAMTQSTMMVASYAVGHGILRPDCCVSLLHDGNPY